MNKDINFFGGGEVNILSNLDLNYGGLIFDKENEYKVTGENVTFKGAGIDIGKDSSVIWDISHVTNDYLHKIGEGTLDVRKVQGTNLKTGNGTVLLNTENSFNNVYISGGKGTVKINAANALSGNPDFGGIFFSDNGGTLDLNGYEQTFKFIAATDHGATITNTSSKKSTVHIRNDNIYMYHGKIDGNIDINNSLETKDENKPLVIDGDVNISGDVIIQNAKLALQGHATEHAIFRNGAQKCPFGNTGPMAIFCDTDHVYYLKLADNLANSKYNTAYKSNNERVSFSQPDWENRTFKFEMLNLKNSIFTVGRNAIVEGDIISNNSTITLGDNTLYIDMYAGSNIIGDGFKFQQNAKSQKSDIDFSENSSYKGNINLNSSSLSINNKFEGGIVAENNSDITVNSKKAIINTGSTISKDSVLTLKKDSNLTAELNFVNNGVVNIGENATLNLQGYSVLGAYVPSIHDIGNVSMNGEGATLSASNYTMFNGDIKANDTASVKLKLGTSDSGLSEFNPNPELTTTMFGDNYNTSWTGSISALKGDAEMVNSIWRMTKDSKLNSLNTIKSLTVFSSEPNTFTTLNINDLKTNDSIFVMRSNATTSDKLVVNNKLEGKNNSLLVDYVAKDGKEKSLNHELISAPKGTSTDVFDAQTQTVGFSDVTPIIDKSESEEKITWTLKGFNSVENQKSAQKAVHFMSAGCKSFLAEVNNLNKRMGDLRDINGEAGAWARIMSGTGSADGGFSDNYTHVQVGADKKHELDGLDLFTGVTMTYTDSHAGSHDFSGETKSVGAGLYASALFESGAYIDLIGKYVHHDNEYTATFAGLGTKDYSSHSWYAGAEVGYRYHVTDDAWIEPQAELVYGAVSGTQFSWKDQGMNVSMANKDSNPLIGRTGVDVGKSFSGKDWKVTARAGLGYQFDLVANGETVLRDASGEKRIKGEKDGRMLMNVGLNAEIRDNVRFGLEFEKSAFGKYNVDNAINANFRYSF